MKKKIIMRCLLGAPLGLAISTVITIIISFLFSDGNFHPVVPTLINIFGNEINAVAVQAFFSLLYGAAWAGGSCIWELEGWSLLRQTLTHLIVCSAATFPVAYLMYWMPHNAAGIALYFGIFFVIYFVIWVSQYLIIRKRVRQLNERLQSKK